MNLATLIFSKNRACQLELLLQSLSLPATVLYTFDRDYWAGYKKVIKMYPETKFVKQTNFKENLLDIIGDTKYILFLTDDDVMIDSLDINSSEFKEFCNDENVLSISLGLTPNVAGTKWEWNKYRGNYRLRMWGYPMSVDSCIFKTLDIIKIIKNKDIKNPNYLETELNLNIPNRSYMMCFNNRKVINNSVNQVQTDFPAHTLEISTDELEKKFLEGKRLSLEDLKKKSENARYYRIKAPYKYEPS